MKIAIVTSLSGLSNAKVRTPTYYNYHHDVDYYAFVSKPQDCLIWKQIPLPIFSSNDDGYRERRNAKFPKLFAHLLIPGYDYYVWQDHYLEVVQHPKKIIENIMKEKEMAIFKHPVRDCAYDEMEAAVFHHKENNIGLLSNYKNFLIDENYPKNNGLFEMTSFAYKNTENVRSMMYSWWELICKYSSRDQLSFPYVLNKHNVSYNIIPGSALQYGGHNEYIQEIWDKFS